MKTITAAAAICALIWRSDASLPDSPDSHLRGGKTRELTGDCGSVGKYYPDSSKSWDEGVCKFSLNCNIQGHETAEECCNAYYPDQSSFSCTCNRDDLDDSLKAACDATLGAVSSQDAATDTEETATGAEETSSTELIHSNTGTWSPKLLGPALGVELLEQCFSDDSKPNAHPCNALETLAALHHDSHGETDHVKEVYDEFNEDMAGGKEPGSACNPQYSSYYLDRFQCSSGHFCKSKMPSVDDVDEGGEYYYQYDEGPGVCEVCPSDFVSRDEPGGCKADKDCIHSCQMPPQGQCGYYTKPGREYQTMMGCPVHELCEEGPFEDFEFHNCVACPSHPDECEDMYNTTNDQDEDLLGYAIDNVEKCQYYCRMPEIMVLANMNGGDKETSYGTPGDMLLLDYNINKKKVVHNRYDNYISINQMGGEFNDYHYSEDSAKEGIRVENEDEMMSDDPEAWDSNWSDVQWSEYYQNRRKHPDYEPYMSEVMLMYCCFHDQFQHNS